MTDTNGRPLLAKARQAADDYLMRAVAQGRMTSEAAAGLAGLGFTTATSVLSTLRRDGLGVEQITAAYGRQLTKAQAAGDERAVIAAEYALAIWSGMLEDLAAYMGGPGAGAQR